MIDETRVCLSSRKRVNGRRSWHARWRDSETGQRRSKYVGTDKRAAKAEAAKIAVELTNGTYVETETVSWHDFVEQHLSAFEGAIETVKDIRRTLTWFGQVCKPAGPHAVSYRMIEAFVAHLRDGRKNSIAVRNKRLRYVRAALNAAVKRQQAKKNPFELWEWTREEQKIPRALSADEKAKLLDACPGHQWRTFVSVAMTTGCRLGEMLSLEWSRVQFGDEPQIIVTVTKGKRDRIQPLSVEAATMLRTLQADTLKDAGPFRAWRKTTVEKHFRKIVESAGIERCTIHDLRKTFCTDLARLGVNQLVVQRLAGHISGATTAKFYQHVDDGMKRAAVEKLSGVAG